MTDRELLEKAARAAGVLLEGVEQDGRGVTIRGTYWQPLHDDGDALRLALKLHFFVSPYYVEAFRDGKEVVSLFEDGPDVYAATRRAIVRAAAQMAKDGE